MNYKYPSYYDTDSVLIEPKMESEIDPSKLKQYLNSLYERMEQAIMVTNGRKYISVIVDKEPTLIFVDKIISVTKSGERAMIICDNDLTYYTENSYVDVIKMILK